MLLQERGQMLLTNRKFSKSLRNASGTYFIKSKISLLMNDKRPQGKLQYTSKKFQTILLNHVDRILYVERRFQHPSSYTRDDQLFGDRLSYMRMDVMSDAQRIVSCLRGSGV